MAKQSASDHALEYIRGYYDKPAFKGAKVKYKGTEGKIIGGKGAHLVLEFPDKTMNGNYHPVWEIEYLDFGGM
jgi:hypothetical protein